MRALLTYFLFLFFTGTAANCSGASFFFLTSEITLGKPVTAVLEITHPADEELLSISDISGSPEVFVREGELEKQIFSDHVKVSRRYDIQFFGTGSNLLFPVTVSLGSGRIVIPTREVTVSGVINEEDTAEIMDIKPPLSVNVPISILLRRLALGALLIVALFLIRRFLFSSKDHRNLHPSPDLRLSPYQEAQVALKKARHLLEQGKLQFLIFSISEIMRRYLGRTYSLHLAEMTTEESISALPENLQEKTRERFIRLSRSWELIKYARLSVTPDQAERDLKEVETLIEEHNSFLEAANAEQDSEKENG